LRYKYHHSFKTFRCFNAIF